jgi:hypothetical protein
MIIQAFNGKNGYYEPNIEYYRRQDFEIDLDLPDGFRFCMSAYRNPKAYSKIVAVLEAQLEQGYILDRAYVRGGKLIADRVPLNCATKREPRFIRAGEIVSLDYCDMKLGHDRRTFEALADFDIDAMLYEYTLYAKLTFTEYLVKRGLTKHRTSNKFYLRDSYELEVSRDEPDTK